MATSFQQQALYRKLIYLGIIVGLFSLSLLHKRLVIEPEALRLQLREQARGEVELTSSVVRLSLTGSRGFAACVLWHMALERQKKHQWNEFEVLVRSVTKLQPHFVTPWLFQSWNLAFNVAVECDRPRDKYFYVSRGLELLAEGERRNQGTLDDSSLANLQALRFPGNPEMRYNMGFFYQLKIAHSDEANTMKCLFDMSCIDPIHRDADQFWSSEGGKKVVDLARFKEFCRRHPRLVRRLHDKLRCDSPRKVVIFLSDNKDVPSRFAQPDPTKAAQRIPTELRPRRDRFPILPPRVLPRMPDPDTLEFIEDFDVMSASQAWYLYALEPLPPPSPDPGLVEPEFDPVRHRLPKMAVHIFRTYPARAQAYMGEHKQKEGWFDDEGWVIPVDWFKKLGERVAVGFELKYQSGPAWHKAHDMYLEYGKETKIYWTPEQRQAVEKEANLFRRTYKLAPEELPVGLKPEQFQGAMKKSYLAHFRLYWNNYYRTSVAFDDYLGQADAERRPEVLRVRKLLHQAQQLRSQAADAQALLAYEAALPEWVNILLKYPAFHKISETQQETYEMQLSYLRVLQDQKAGLVEFSEGRWQPKRMGLRPLLLGLAQFGLATPHHNPLLTQLPALVLDKSVKVQHQGETRELAVLDEADIRRIIPIRKVRGPLEFIYLFDVPGREYLQLYLLGLTQGAIRPPLLWADYLREWTLVTRIDRDRAPRQAFWQPLLTDENINAVRQQLGLDR